MSDLSNVNLAKGSKLGVAALESVAEIFKVLADPGRLALLQELKAGEKTVTELVEGMQMAQPSVSKHLKVLADADLVCRRKDGVKVYYSMKGELVFPLCRLVCEKLSQEQQQRVMVDYSI
ncbi:MAG: metalloregulator ArsR/SmtB family transcription factor [Akkermansiaceae bacterium]|jgi:DNA-binding transcriptional ArsR family regulator|nr:metalloregulator ArsR/SmtB family transcription factor [Akkermansiaceae bacterium]MDP4648175.1 metalloregulator ArsR/SmtB family transcription factor [Akkermansiaceae bacterium]MDP4721156.1 metalloregulator ArsR/SmtB family transcription factor [Akkermansiaceae bacterium]MDP4778896.1 metalloregulator ArsR/SmtB family transcription factor [Akkermansiaceae bacterium]MDP4846902.1 metalloregulator ArsR/SmtB family transcription factor [Akkermansiaceae bacterium]